MNLLAETLQELIDLEAFLIPIPIPPRTLLTPLSPSTPYVHSELMSLGANRSLVVRLYSFK